MEEVEDEAEGGGTEGGADVGVCRASEKSESLIWLCSRPLCLLNKKNKFPLLKVKVQFMVTNGKYDFL